MLRNRLIRKDEGFTLVELMVVVLIIAILLAIAIPTFLGARSRAQNRAAESHLRNGLTAEKTVYTDAQAYSATAGTMSAAEPSLNWVTAAPSGATDVEISLPDTTAGMTSNVICLRGKSASGTFFAIEDVAQTDAAYGASGTFYGSNPSVNVTCPTANAAGSPVTYTGPAGTDVWSTTTSVALW